MLGIIDKEYVAEKKAISKEFEEKKIELKDTLIADLEEKRKNIENQRLSIDISGDQTEPKPAMTRKLRRRPNDPLPVPDKRRKNPPIQLNYLLDDRDIDDDLREINAAKYSCVKKGTTFRQITIHNRYLPRDGRLNVFNLYNFKQAVARQINL